jgi:hypothetical protein
MWISEKPEREGKIFHSHFTALLFFFGGGGVAKIEKSGY